MRLQDEQMKQKRNDLIKRRTKRKAKRHHHGEEKILKISLRQTRHRTRIIKLQSALKDKAVEYTIAKGEKDDRFEIVKNGDITELHFRSRVKEPDEFHLVIHGKPKNGIATELESWERPLTLRIHLIVVE